MGGVVSAGSIMLEFRPHEGGQLVAMATVNGRTVAAIVHPENETGTRRWALAGDIDRLRPRPAGEADTATAACGEVSNALGVELGVGVTGWTVAR